MAIMIQTIKFLSGGSGDGYTLDNILQFDGEFQQWDEVGQLRQSRAYHATSVLNINQIDAYLNCD